MAYWYNNDYKFKSPNRRAFFCDTAADLAKLPTTTTEGVLQPNGNNVVCQKVTMGSVVYVIGTGDWYLLNSKDQWIKKQ